MQQVISLTFRAYDNLPVEMRATLRSLLLKTTLVRCQPKKVDDDAKNFSWCCILPISRPILET